LYAQPTAAYCAAVFEAPTPLAAFRAIRSSLHQDSIIPTVPTEVILRDRLTTNSFLYCWARGQVLRTARPRPDTCLDIVSCPERRYRCPVLDTNAESVMIRAGALS
jgi:hypothetical protein